MSGHYEKAVMFPDVDVIVYASQLYDVKIIADDSPRASDFDVIKVGNFLEIWPSNWVVWHPENRKHEIISDREFRERYTLYEDLPPKIKAMADKYPSYEEWVEQCNRLDKAPVQ